MRLALLVIFDIFGNRHSAIRRHIFDVGSMEREGV